ncbi:MAG TPA: rhodanese-like domain-containing protein [Pyrinomonadaceae bacterium]|nr:rhodanese-like domain-containing protein [Pyrinomonadaceae bacterium]
MRLFFSLLAAVALAVLMLAGCNSQDMKGNVAGGSGKSATTPASSSAQNVPSDGVRRITTVELRDDLDKGNTIVIDTRPLENYKQSHIKGSISVPLDQVQSRINELPRDKMIVAYCS